MTNPLVPVAASSPIPPPTAVLPVVNPDGRWTPGGLEFMQMLWAAIQGQGGILDELLLTQPDYGQALALAQSALSQSNLSESAVQGLRGQVAALRRIIDEAYALASAPRPPPWQPPASANAGGAGATDTVTTTEAIGPDMLGHIYPAGVQKADAASGGTKPCNCFVVAAYVLGASATIYQPGQYITGLGLTPLTTYWLGNGGALSSAPPAAGSGAQQQQVGVADSTGTKLFFFPQLELQTV